MAELPRLSLDDITVMTKALQESDKQLNIEANEMRGSEVGRELTVRIGENLRWWLFLNSQL